MSKQTSYGLFHGDIQLIARMTDYSPETVRKVLRGLRKTKNQVVEKAIAKVRRQNSDHRPLSRRIVRRAA